MYRARFRFNILSLVAIAGLLSGCSKQPQWEGSLEKFLESQAFRFGQAIENPDYYRVQVIYTQINRDENNQPEFATFEYRVSQDEYFYPASTVKLPTALLALEKINDLNRAGLNRNTPMITGASGPTQTSVVSDESSQSGLPSVAHYIRKILLVSDNDAFNRLYEFLGQQPLNEAMHAKGYRDSRIMHRLETALSLEENGHTNPVVFIEEDSVVYSQQAQTSTRNFTASAPILLGQAEVVGEDLLQRPKDFAEKNAYPLREQHDVIKALMFPESVDFSARFDLVEDDYQFVYEYMSMYPGESDITDYDDAARYPPGYVKFLMYGGEATEIPSGIRIFNKVGDAYGFLTDAAYIVDFDNGIEFLLAATVYTNANETFNDNLYEYEEIGMPFLRELGMAIYELELQRARPRRPDLSRFRKSEKSANR